MSDMSDLTETRMKRAKGSSARLAVLLVVGVVLGTLLGLALVRLSQGRPLFPPPIRYGVEFPPGEPLEFSLVGQGGETVNLSDFRGKPTLLYFGYTYCPDVCPATMVELKWMMAELGRQADEVQVILVSVDPERDTPEQLQGYVTQFHPSFVGLTGSEEALTAVTHQFGIYVNKHEGTPASGYLIDHTASVQVVDGNGRLRLVFPFGTTGKEMAADMRHLLRSRE